MYEIDCSFFMAESSVYLNMFAGNLCDRPHPYLSFSQDFNAIYEEITYNVLKVTSKERPDSNEGSILATLNKIKLNET